MLAQMPHGRSLIPAVSACTLTRKQEAVVDTHDRHVSRAHTKLHLLPVDP